MKNAIRGAFLFLSISLLIIVVLDITTNGVKKTETADIANNAAYQAISTKAEGVNEIENIDELVAEAIKEIVMTKNSNASIKVQVLGIDAENGLLDINVIQTLKHSNGKETVSEERRTVILENYK